MKIPRPASLRTRLILAYAGLIVVGFAALAVFAGQQISTAAEEDYEKQLEAQAALMAEGLSDTVGYFIDGRILPSELASFVRAQARRAGVRLTVMDHEGEIWIDSSGITPGDDQTSNPEIVAALDGRIVHDLRANESGAMMLYTAAPIYEGTELIGVVQLSSPAGIIDAAVRRRWSVLAGGILALTAIALGASLWLSASMTRPLADLRAAAMDVAGGDFSRRLPEDRNDEIGQLAVTYNHLARQVEAMLAEQRAFAANASHELRTPLTTIRLRTEALRNGELDEETADRYLAEVDDEVTRLSALVEDLILLARLDAGRLEPGVEPIDPLRLARGLLRELEPQAAARDVALTFDAPDHLPGVHAAQTHLRVAWRNLLENAIKYTPPGGRVTWHLAADDGWLCAQITDSGEGIDPDDLPHLVERFYRADKARTRRVAGAGLGLSLTQLIAEYYGAELAISSPGVGQGTTAELRWPLTPIGVGKADEAG